MKSDKIWGSKGDNDYFEHYRKSEDFEPLRNWVSSAYEKTKEYLDRDYINALRNVDFYARLWELELAEWFIMAGLSLVDTNGKFDFCIQSKDGRKIWIEAVTARADEELESLFMKNLNSKNDQNVPRTKIALRYSSVIYSKSNKIKDEYLSVVGDEDVVIIAVSGFAPGALRSDYDIFLTSVLPIQFPVIHFSRDGSELDSTVPRPTHSMQREHLKTSGSSVKKEFLYPGEEFTHINAILFSEASNLQKLLGTYSSSFDQSTNTPHILNRYKASQASKEFTRNFYNHYFIDKGELVSLVQEAPEIMLQETN